VLGNTWISGSLSACRTGPHAWRYSGVYIPLGEDMSTMSE